MKSIIANQIVQGTLRSAQPEFDHIARLLECPIEPNHAPRHPSLAVLTATEARDRAEVYCFDRITTQVATSIMDSQRRRQHVFRDCRSPFPRMFLDFEEGAKRSAIFVEGDRSNCQISVIDQFVNFPEPILSLTLRRVNFDDFQGLGGLRLNYITYRYPSIRKDTVSWFDDQSVAQYTYYVAAFWTFLSLHSVATVTHHITREGRIARKRGKLRAMGAIDSYNSVTLVLPRRDYSSTTMHLKHGPGVRWHTVAGHWREYRPNERRILGWMTWIADHERGDARKGVVIKDRNVRARVE